MKNAENSWEVVAQATFNPSTWWAEGSQISESEASVVYRTSSRTATATQENPFLESKNNKPEQNRKNAKEILRDGCFIPKLLFSLPFSWHPGPRSNETPVTLAWLNARLGSAWLSFKFSHTPLCDLGFCLQVPQHQFLHCKDNLHIIDLFGPFLWDKVRPF